MLLSDVDQSISTCNNIEINNMNLNATNVPSGILTLLVESVKKVEKSCHICFRNNIVNTFL